MPPVAQHMIDGVRYALDFVDEYLDTYGADNVEVISEKRVYIGSMLGITDEECNGTTDLMLRHLDGTCLTIADYKHGVRVVDAEENTQMMLYTLGAVKEHGKHKRYKNVIIQPRAPKKRPVEEHTYTQGKLTMFLKDVSKSAQAALLPNAPRVAGDHCTFCKASANCETYRRRARQVAADEFGVIGDPEELPLERFDEVLAEAQLLKSWIKAVEARALAHAMQGGKLRDYELGWGSRKRVFQDPEAVLDWCRRQKLPLDEVMPRGLLTPKQLEALLKRLKRYPRKARGEAAPTSPIEHLVGYTTPTPKLKPKGAPDATDDFDEA